MRRFIFICLLTFGWAGAAHADAAQTLQATYHALDTSLQQSPFHSPLLLSSTETPNLVAGDVHAVVDYPFGTVNATLNTPAHWCEVISLHLNTKFCSSEKATSGSKLRVRIGSKGPQEVAQASPLEFSFTLAALSPQYLAVILSAKDGPMGTSDYRISMEAIPLSPGKTFLHLRYSYAVNLVGRVAMQTYLTTLGRNKVGFTVAGQRSNGDPDYIAGVRGVLERNIMRYYLAIDTCLQTASLPVADQFERRLQLWFSAIERYPRQLHDLERTEYVDMKRAEHAREAEIP